MIRTRLGPVVLVIRIIILVLVRILNSNTSTRSIIAIVSMIVEQ